MASITEYESSRLLDFFKNHPDNEKKLIAIAKTITKNTLTHLSLNGKTCHDQTLRDSESFLFRCLQNRSPALGISRKYFESETDFKRDSVQILDRQQHPSYEQLHQDDSRGTSDWVLEKRREWHSPRPAPDPQQPDSQSPRREPHQKIRELSSELHGPELRQLVLQKLEREHNSAERLLERRNLSDTNDRQFQRRQRRLDDNFWAGSEPAVFNQESIQFLLQPERVIRGHSREVSCANHPLEDHDFHFFFIPGWSITV